MGISKRTRESEMTNHQIGRGKSVHMSFPGQTGAGISSCGASQRRNGHRGALVTFVKGEVTCASCIKRRETDHAEALEMNEAMAPATTEAPAPRFIAVEAGGAWIVWDNETRGAVATHRGFHRRQDARADAADRNGLLE
jgi:hypothetical protein